MHISQYHNTQWQQKDWSFFAGLVDCPLDQHPEKDFFALVLAGAALQLADKELTKRLISKALGLIQKRQQFDQFVLMVVQAQLAKAQWQAGYPEKALQQFQSGWKLFGTLTIPLFYDFLCQAAESQLQNDDARGAIQTWQDIATVMQEQTPEQVYHRMSHCYEMNSTGFGGSSEENKTWGDFHKHDLLELFHQHLQPDFYFEIGVDQGLSLALAKGKALGVDARPQLDLQVELSDSTKIIGMSSDGFFRELAADAFIKAPDLAFIDGMHLFEFALRDFINLEKYAASWALVGIDDVFPCHPAQAERRRRSNSWTGDVWKLIPILEKYRPDLLLLKLRCSTTGLLLIAGLDSENKVLEAHYDEIMQAYQSDLTIPESILQRSETLPSDHPFVSMLLSVLRNAKNDATSVVALKKGLSFVQGLVDLNKADLENAAPFMPDYAKALHNVECKQNMAHTTMTLYWRTAETSYNEKDSIKLHYVLNGQVQEFSLPIPNVEEGLSGLRFDIADKEGVYFMHQMQVISQDADLLWVFENDKVTNIYQLDIFTLSNKDTCMVSTGNDPHFDLNIDADMLHGLIGAKLKITLSAVVMSRASESGSLR